MAKRNTKKTRQQRKIAATKARNERRQQNSERANYKVWREGNCTKKTWTDTSITGKTIDERMAQWNSRRDERQEEYNNDGFGLRMYCPLTNEVTDITFDDNF